MKQAGIITILVTTLLLNVSLQPVKASAIRQSEESAKLVKQVTISSLDPKEVEISRCTRMLSNFLAREGPILAPYARVFAKEAYANNLDCTLVAAIAGHESAFGQHIAVAYNGWGWCGGFKCPFASWEDGISTVSRTLNETYCQKWGACNDPYAIGRYYAEDPKWASKVSFIIQRIKTYSARQTVSFELTI